MRHLKDWLAVAFVVLVCAAAMSVASDAWAAAGGGPGNPIVIGEITFSLDAAGTVALPHDYIERGQEFYVHVSGIIDDDRIADPDEGFDEIDKVVWYRQTRAIGETTWPADWGTAVFTDNNPENYNTNSYRSTYHETEPGVIGVSHEVRYKVIAYDAAAETGSPTHDPAKSKTGPVKRICGVDYVIVAPNEAKVATEGQVTLTGKAYDLGGDEERHFNDAGEIIEGTADNDTLLEESFTWTRFAFCLGYVDPEEGATTAFNAGQMAGQCRVMATFDEDPEDPDNPTVSGSALVVIEGECSIDLVGINFDDVQDIPLNAALPLSRDGTGTVGRIKAKVLVAAAPSTEYRVVISRFGEGGILVAGHENSDFIILKTPEGSLVMATAGGSMIAVTTGEEGTAEMEIELYADEGCFPSAATGGDELCAYLCEVPPEGQDWLVASATTDDTLTVYKFNYALLPPSIFFLPEHSDNAMFGDFFVLAGVWSSGVPEYSTLEEHFRMRVETYPQGAFSGRVRSRAHLIFSTQYDWYLAKGGNEEGSPLSLSFDFKFIGVNYTFSGTHAIAAIAIDFASWMPGDDKWHEYGGEGNTFTKSTAEFPPVYPFPCLVQQDSLTVTQHRYDTEERAYSVGNDTETYTVKLGLSTGVKTTRVWSGTNGCSAQGSIACKDGEYDPANPGTIINTHVEDIDNVFEIIEFN
ncbi:MAG: hypothetical protein JXQ75_10660 [Phycisphaerae bacterium]|nr:hypothetical protein [Phycisphaerae bacterium]